MRKVLLLAALAMAATLVFAPMAMAQDDLNCADLSEAEEQSVFAADPSDPNNLDANDNGVPCEDDTTDNGSYVPPADDDPSRPADGPDDVQYGPDDVIDETVPTTTVLPETGGVSAAIVVLPLALLLVGGGLLAFRVVRRS